MRVYKLFFSIFFFSVLVGIFPIFSFASESSGTIDTTYKSTKICKNASCSEYGNINWKPTSGTAVTIVDASGLSGYIWGDEIGWVNLNPTGYGVDISTSTGALSGYAYSQTGSWINFSPTDVSGGTDVGVTINSSGQFVGWAWVSGAHGGWMKFDCASASTCVKTDWRPFSARGAVEEEEEEETPSSSGGSSGSRPSSQTSTTTAVEEIIPKYVFQEENKVTDAVEPSKSLMTFLGDQEIACDDADVCSFNKPLVVDRGQSGILVYEFGRGVGSVIEIDEEGNPLKDFLNIDIKSYFLSRSDDIFDNDVSIMGETIFDVRAFDKSGNEIHSFSKSIRITLIVPDYLKGDPDIGVYWLNEKKNEWTKVPHVSFSDSGVAFYVDHLTKFAIIKYPDSPDTIDANELSQSYGLDTDDSRGYDKSKMILYVFYVIIFIIIVMIFIIPKPRKNLHEN